MATKEQLENVVFMEAVAQTTTSVTKSLQWQLTIVMTRFSSVITPLGKVAMKVISVARFTCDLETEMLILTMYFEKYLKV